MGHVIHRRHTLDGPRYRYWSEDLGKYLTPELTREQLVEYLKAEARELADRRYNEIVSEIEARVRRAESTGTSSWVGYRGTEQDWNTEETG